MSFCIEFATSDPGPTAYRCSLLGAYHQARLRLSSVGASGAGSTFGYQVKCSAASASPSSGASSCLSSVDSRGQASFSVLPCRRSMSTQPQPSCSPTRSTPGVGRGSFPCRVSRIVRSVGSSSRWTGGNSLSARVFADRRTASGDGRVNYPCAPAGSVPRRARGGRRRPGRRWPVVPSR